MRLGAACLTAVLLSLALSAGCDRTAAKQAPVAAGPQAQQRPALRRTTPAQDKVDVVEAVFRHELDHMVHAQNQFVFLTVDQADPTPEFLARFAGYGRPILPASMAASNGQHVTHKDSAATASSCTSIPSSGSMPTPRK